jgi:trimethylamine:corrinoid methyltransferase-like protein
LRWTFILSVGGAIHATSQTTRGRSARRATRDATDFSMLHGLTRTLPVCGVMDDHQVQRINEASMSDHAGY